MSSSSALGTFAADEKHRYEFTVTFDSGGEQRLPGRHVDGNVPVGRGPVTHNA